MIYSAKNWGWRQLCADNSKAKRLFSWQPSYAGRDGFQHGLVETAESFIQLANLRTYKADIYIVYTGQHSRRWAGNSPAPLHEGTAETANAA